MEVAPFSNACAGIVRLHSVIRTVKSMICFFLSFRLYSRESLVPITKEISLLTILKFFRQAVLVTTVMATAHLTQALFVATQMRKMMTLTGECATDEPHIPTITLDLDVITLQGVVSILMYQTVVSQCAGHVPMTLDLDAITLQGVVSILMYQTIVSQCVIFL